MIDRSISRRGFISGAAAISAAAFGSRGISLAHAEELAATAPTMPSFFSKPDQVKDADINEEHDYDIVVVGAGHAGLAAAASAIKNGVSVCVVEKAEATNTQGNEASGIDLSKSDEAAVQYLVNEHLKANGFRPRRDVVETWAHRSGEALHFLMDFHADGDNPLKYEYDEGEVKPIEYPDTDKVATLFWIVPTEGNYMAAGKSLAAQVERKGADFYYSMPAQQLVQDASGAVTGVICQSSDGKLVRFNANRGVILCAGDYQNDPEMVSWLLPDFATSEPKQVGKTGDGIKMALWAGGVIEPVGHTKMSHGYGAGPMGDQPFLLLNMAGERFCSEDTPLWQRQTFFRFDDQTCQYVQLFDANYETQVKGWGGTPTAQEKLSSYMPESPDYKKGQLFSADTLEELAEKLKVTDVDAFVASVKRYNELAAQGTDDDFGKPAKYLKPVDTPPFYGVYRSQGITAITSGVITDAEQRVLDADDKPIPGLYAAGNTAGGFFGAIDYPLRTIEGLSIGKAMTGGYVAAETAAKA
ncbi:FAD-dependent oxidoreductase [bacterium]|nr:FAD-dependent oxidoreductase [bacterium]